MKQTLYKLTARDNTTMHNYAWGPGVTLSADLSLPPELCSAGVIHAYRGAELALFMNPIYASIERPRLWVAEGEVCADDGTKVGCRALTTLREIEYQEPTTEQRVRFGILCALEVCSNPGFVAWVHGWLKGLLDHSEAAASAAWAARRAAAEAARGDKTINLVEIAKAAMEGERK